MKAGADVNAEGYFLEPQHNFTPLGAAQRVVCFGDSELYEIDSALREVVGTLLRAGATIQPRYAADPTPDILQEIEDMNERHDIRVNYARELSMYFRAVLAAGGFETYGQARRAPFVAMLDRGLSLPRDAISVICEFWLRVDEYYPGTDALIQFY